MTSDTTSQQDCDFGFEKVSSAEKTRRVGEVFDSVAGDYDLMNDLMSFGIHRVWKWIAVTICNVRAGHKVLDLAGGTGDLTQRFARLVGEKGVVVLADFNRSMLTVGRNRLLDAGFYSNVLFCQANAEVLPFQENYFDCIMMAFGLRNVTDKAAALRSMQRVLKPGGKLIVLEFSKLVIPGLKPLYDAYSFNILPKLGEWIVKDGDSYRYLAESIRVHPDQQTLIDMMTQAGFEDCEYFNISGGIVAIHRGYKY